MNAIEIRSEKADIIRLSLAVILAVSGGDPIEIKPISSWQGIYASCTASNVKVVSIPIPLAPYTPAVITPEEAAAIERYRLRRIRQQDAHFALVASFRRCFLSSGLERIHLGSSGDGQCRGW